MNSEDWLEVHREEIVENWKARVRPLVDGMISASVWEDRVAACFEQVRSLVAHNQISLAAEDVEEKLFNCPELGSHEQHRISAWMLASGRRVIGEITGSSGGPEAHRCASAAQGAINYLQHSLRINVCQDCSLTTCCMRAESLEPLRGGLSE